MSKALWALIGLLILVPLSVDNYWSIHVSEFKLRINYFGAFLVFVLAFFEIVIVRRRDLQQKLSHYLRQPFVGAFTLMALIGLLGTYQSPRPFRATFFLIWSAGTLLFVPLLVDLLIVRLRSWVPRAFMIYFAVQSLVILTDTAICIPSHGQWSIGRVMIYHHDTVASLCRPHAWYQEPGYFAAFALLALIVTRIWVQFETSTLFKKVSVASMILGALATLATTSRMGWLGVALLIPFELVLQFKKGGESKFKVGKLGYAMIAVPLVIVGLVGVTQWKSIYENVGKGLVSPTQDASFKSRYSRVVAGLEVFEHNRWVGAGPGTAGAYYAKQLHDGLLASFLTPADMETLNHDPLSQNLYTELLSEWGALGTMFFFLGLGLLLWPVTPFFRLATLAVLILIYSSTQTLPRFDLWFVLSLIRSLSLNPCLKTDPSAMI